MIRSLRSRKGVFREEPARAVFVTRQAVSRWETGETVPNTETLKLLSGYFGVSVNTLLGSPRKLFCQCCGMPMEDDAVLSREKDGAFNEDYCKWCCADGQFAYPTLDSLIDFLTAHFPSGGLSPEQARASYREHLSRLGHWKQA